MLSAKEGERLILLGALGKLASNKWFLAAQGNKEELEKAKGPKKGALRFLARKVVRDDEAGGCGSWRGPARSHESALKVFALGGVQEVEGKVA